MSGNVAGAPTAAGRSAAGASAPAARGSRGQRASTPPAAGRAGAPTAGRQSPPPPPSAGRPAPAVDDDAGTPKPTDPRSCKRGVGYGFDPSGATDDVAALAKGTTWYYSWADRPNAQLAGKLDPLGVEFVPMVWGGSFKVDDVVREIPEGARFLLGFNEPNFYAQANLTPQRAAELWPALEEIARRRQLALVSPALNYCGGGCNVTNPVEWLDQFFAACKDCQVDYVAIHWYACALEPLRSYVAMFKKYGRPIWLTEFSCGDQGAQPVAKQQTYMREALAYLESDPDVFRYAWFAGRTEAIANVDLLAEPGKLSALGNDYVTLPVKPARCDP